MTLCSHIQRKRYTLMTEKDWTKEDIREQLASNNKWLVRGVIANFNFQTASEQSSDETNQNNGVGFNGSDAFIMSRFAKFAKKTGFLTPKQTAIARKKMLKYAGQLAKIANGKIVISGA